MKAIPDPHGGSAEGCENFCADSELAHFWLFLYESLPTLQYVPQVDVLV